jgi:antitoxin VapB
VRPPVWIHLSLGRRVVCVDAIVALCAASHSPGSRCGAARDAGIGYRFEGNEVYISKEGDKVILSPKPTSWVDFFDSPLQATQDFMAIWKHRPLREPEVL